MLFEKIFSGGNSSKDMHSNQYAVGSTSKRTFSQRKTVEQGRSRIAAYRQSKLGWGVAPRGEASRQKPSITSADASSQATNLGAAGPHAPVTPPQRSFQEPSARSFNPYS